MRTNKDNWKTKIDPAFDKAVRYYVTILDNIENSPSEVYIQAVSFILK